MLTDFCQERLLPLPPLKQGMHTTPLGLGVLSHVGGLQASQVRQPVVIVTRRGSRTPLLPPMLDSGVVCFLTLVETASVARLAYKQLVSPRGVGGVDSRVKALG